MKPVLLVIRDGWGVNNAPELAPFNAIAQADTPFCDQLTSAWPRTELAAHGPDVGVPPGIMGNSEVGHQNIGAGRIVDQEIMRINKGLEDLDVMQANPALKKAIDRVKGGSGKLHLMGLVSDAGVHAMVEHLYKLLEIGRLAGLEEIYIHAFTDGRDTAPTSGLSYVRDLEAKCKEIGIGQVASVCGRFWAMDRDKRWDRVEKAYDMLTGKEAPIALSAEAAIQGYYDAPAGESMKGDEFVPPTWIADETGEPRATFADGDSVVFFNFRGDRPREITSALISDDFDGFDRGDKLDLVYATMTDYQKGLCPDIVFPKPPKMPNILGSYLSDKGIRQFRCAETEKYPHVTFFFNDYRDEPFEKEERQVLESPKVATYDEAPEMSAQGVMDAAEEAILSERYGLVVVNFANPDMVGHTGSIPACVRACEIVDRGVEKLCRAIDKTGGVAVVTADHGNCDQMGYPDSEAIHTAHTLNPVELVLYGSSIKDVKLLPSDNRLADIAPTILDLMGVEKPEEMTGKSLIITS